VLRSVRDNRHDISFHAILNDQMTPGTITGGDGRSPHSPERAASEEHEADE
jgi:hypothetical protein